MRIKLLFIGKLVKFMFKSRMKQFKRYNPGNQYVLVPIRGYEMLVFRKLLRKYKINDP